MPRQFAYDASPSFRLSDQPGEGLYQYRTDRFLYPPTLTVKGAFGAGSVAVGITTLRSTAAGDSAPFAIITADSAIILPVGYLVTLSTIGALTGVDAAIGGIAFSPWTDFTISGP